MTEFEDNAVVTTEDLNNIAVDLGDTTFSAFSDAKFGVDKLNEITADIVGKGVLNIGNKCVPVLDGGIVYIQSGVIVFESGAKIRITSPVEVTASAGDYIYAFNDVTTGKASIQTAAEYPTSGDYVMLAQRTADGSVLDLRQMSVAKTTLSAAVENNIVEQEARVYWDYTTKTSEWPVSPNLIGCKYIFFPKDDPPDNSYAREYWYSIKLTEEYQCCYYYNSSDSHRYLYVKKVDGLLYFKSNYNIYSGFEKITFILA